MTQNLELLQNSQIQSNQQFHLMAFKGLINGLLAISGQMFMRDLQKYSEIEQEILNTIRAASKPYAFSDQISKEYFDYLVSFIG